MITVKKSVSQEPQWYLIWGVEKPLEQSFEETKELCSHFNIEIDARCINIYFKNKDAADFIAFILNS